MTFIKLDTDNFVNNTIKCTVENYFDRSDKKTWVSVLDDYSERVFIKQSDKNYEENILISNPESPVLKLNFSSSEDLIIYNKFNLLLRNFGLGNLDIKEYEQLKDDVSGYLGISKSDLLKNISISGIRELKGIEYLKPRFLVNDSFAFKKNSIKNVLYEKYSQGFHEERLSNPYFGFCNYNTLNFTSVLAKDKGHKNIVIYENRYKKENRNKYDFINHNSFCFQSRIIFRNSDDIERPGCILHIPGIINVFIVKTPLQDTGRLVISLGEYTQKNFFYEFASSSETITEDFLSINSLRRQEKMKTYISDICFKENHWHTIFLQIDKINKSIDIFIDGEKIDVFNFNLNIENQNKNSYICFGNTLSYYNNKTSSIIDDIDKCFHFIFNEFSQENKPIDLYSSKDDLIIYHTIEDLIAENFELNISNNSFCFLGEISDIRFYKSKFFDEEIKSFNLKYVEDLYDERLEFYVPVMYVPRMIGKKGILFLDDRKENIAYSTYYNPYFSSLCGGLEMNPESFLVEFKKNNIPNIVICGGKSENFYLDNITVGLNTLLEEETFLNDLKSGININELYNKIYKKEFTNKNYSINDNLNILFFKNSFILPNDNGTPSVDFSIIEKYISLYLDDKKNTVIEKNKLNNINTKDLFLNNYEYLIKDFNNYKIFSSIKDEIFYIKKSENEYVKYEFTRDILSDISNILYYDIRFDNIDQLRYYLSESIKGNINEDLYEIDIELYNKINSIINTIDIIFTGQEKITNPIYRFNIKKSLNFNLEESNGNIYKKIKNNIGESIYYKKSNIVYNNITSDYDSFFISIIDIPSCFYNNKLDKNSINIKIPFKVNILNKEYMNLKDDGYSSLYRADCLSKVAKWNYIGHIFYNEGLAIIHNPLFTNVDQDNFIFVSSSESSINTKEVNIPVDYAEKNFSTNKTYDDKLRIDSSAINFEEPFVYITDVYLHDDRFNILCKTKIANPISKKDSDRFLIRVKSDF